MPIIELVTVVCSTPERVFDLSLDVDAHQASAHGTEERVVAGVRSGKLKLGDEITWEARHDGACLELQAGGGERQATSQ